MNITEPELEKILARAPRPTPPAGLKELLKARAGDKRLRGMKQTLGARPPRSWLGRWWSALAPTMASLACAVVVSRQQQELNELKQSLTVVEAPSESTQPNQPDTSLSRKKTGAAESPVAESTQIAQLTQVAAQLEAEIAQLEQMQAENERLRALLGNPQVAGLSAEETESVEQAKEKAWSTECINHLKQFGLAVRVWALDENETQPPNVQCMSNELSVTQILICPADKSRQAAANFFVFTPANCSYEYLVTTGTNVAATEPTRVLTRCPIHGHIGLCDGSVQRGVAKEHPDWLVNRNGKIYYQPK